MRDVGATLWATSVRPRSMAARSAAMSAYRGWLASIWRVRPWMFVGTGSTPESSRLTTAFSIVPAASTATAAKLMTRQWSE